MDNLGNYYEDYSGCVDSNNDGFCDVDYDDGEGWGTKKALSSYPFDYTQHLFTAESVVDTLLYNITLLNIINNETINLVDGTETLLFEFEHDSDFNDLNCGFIIDGINKGEVIAYLKNTTYNLSISGGWTEKTYTYRVECSNEFTTKTSEELNFIISFSPVAVLGCTDSNANNYNPLANQDDGSCTYDDIGETGGNITIGDIGLGELFSGDVDKSTDSLNELFSVSSTPLSYFMLIGFIILSIATIILIVSLPYLFIGGNK